MEIKRTNRDRSRMMRHQEVTFAAGSIPRLEFPIAVEMSPRKRYSKQSGTLRNKSGESLAASSSLTVKRKVNNIAEELKEKVRKNVSNVLIFPLYIYIIMITIIIIIITRCG